MDYGGANVPRQRAGNNRIQVPRSLNQCCAPDSYLESMSLARPSLTFFDKSEADVMTLVQLVRLVPNNGHLGASIGPVRGRKAADQPPIDAFL